MITKEEATKFLANKYGFKLEVSDLKFTNSKRRTGFSHKEISFVMSASKAWSKKNMMHMLKPVL